MWVYYCSRHLETDLHSRNFYFSDYRITAALGARILMRFNGQWSTIEDGNLTLACPLQLVKCVWFYKWRVNKKSYDKKGGKKKILTCMQSVNCLHHIFPVFLLQTLLHFFFLFILQLCKLSPLYFSIFMLQTLLLFSSFFMLQIV